MSEPVLFGLEIASSEPPAILRDARRVGLLCNQASVDQRYVHAADCLHELLGDRLVALFGPQHGLWSTEQDNMVETSHARHPRLGIPVHSLYSETRRPTRAMLDGIDLLVVDLQDVGSRVYTYVWTLTNCMAACAEQGVPVLVLDRPNPLGGEAAEGPRLDLAYASFVGGAAIPMRHGLTLGELAQLCNRELGLGAKLHVVAMQGWRRSMLWPDTHRAWVPPSPNLPRFEGALVYPGQVLIEGTRLSEGRGTTTPFENFGAPFVDPYALLDALRSRAPTGVTLRPVHFEPTFQKHVGRPCGGLFLHVTEPRAYHALRTSVALLRAIRELWPQSQWLPPPYEYETEKMPIDILGGGPDIRAFVDGKLPWSELEPLTAAPTDWWQQVAPDLLY